MNNQEAIEDIEKNILPVVGGKSLRMAISALQAQDSPKPIAESVQNVQNEDLISRKAAIEAFMAATSDGDKAEWCKWVLEQLPSAHPVAKDIDVPCKDTISRQAAINAVGYYSVLSGDKLLFADNALKELPYAQPEHEKGKWTKDCACEICGFKPWYERDIHTLSFCPNCGADMREDQTDDNRPS